MNLDQFIKEAKKLKIKDYNPVLKMMRTSWGKRAKESEYHTIRKSWPYIVVLSIYAKHGTPKDNKKRTLTIDNRSFSKTNFWALPHKGQYIIFAGRTLRSNVAALTADDNQWAKKIFEGIFEIVPGDEFFTKSVAKANREGDMFTIELIGEVQIPSRNT